MRVDRLAFPVVAAIVGFIYWITSGPGIGLVDSGELTTVAYTLGIAHPTGYPLYTILGRVWLFLIPMSPDRAMVVYSAMAGAAACGFLSLAVLRLFSTNGVSLRLSTAMAIILSIGFALSYTAWSSVDFAEVYPLSWLIVAAILWLSVSILTMREISAASLRSSLLVCYLWGLGLGNHLTIVWFIPLLIVVIWRCASRALHPVRLVGMAAAAILLGATTILFLPIRSTLDPVLDWGDPQSLEKLFRHLSAWQYQVWMFTGGLTALLGKLVNHLSQMPREIGWATVILASVGLWRSVSRKLLLGFTLFGIWAVGTAYNLNYDIPDISTYFLVFFCAIFLLAVLGIIHLIEGLDRWGKGRVSHKIVSLLLAASVPIASLAATAKSAVASEDDFAKRFLMEILRTIPDSSLVLQGNWDIQSPFIYYQRIENVRPDIVMLDINLMQRSWYIKEQRRNHPDVFQGINRQVELFMDAVAPFESRQRYDAQRIESAFVEMHNSMIRLQRTHRPVYVRDVEAAGHSGIAASFPKTPGAYFWRITDDPNKSEPVLCADNFIPPSGKISERQRYLLNEAAVSSLLQMQDAYSRRDTIHYFAALASARTLSEGNPRLTKFMRQIEQNWEGNSE
ncbi:DUF2723 domain-containing protein [bacterium]|nr:DUF2723 domain-containing protein [bacterium]MBU1985323.1 DUF2723 domain-containing protein [bacterium]